MKPSDALACAVLLIAGALVAGAARATPPGLDTRARTGATADRVVHLTFDDGPDPVNTPRLLDALDRLHVRATFFLLADRLERPGALEVARETARRGHELAVHGYHHVALGRLANADAVTQLDDAARIFDAAGLHPTLFRPPYGNTTSRLDAAIDAHGWRVALWALNPADYAATDADAAVHTFDRLLARQERAGVRGGLVLMHDTHPFVVEEVEGVLGVLKSRSCTALSHGEPPYQLASDARALLDAQPPAGATLTPLASPALCGPQ